MTAAAATIPELKPLAEQIEELKERDAKLETVLFAMNEQTLSISTAISAAGREARKARADVAVDPSQSSKTCATKASNRLDELSTREVQLYEPPQSLETELQEQEQELRTLNAADLRAMLRAKASRH